MKGSAIVFTVLFWLSALAPSTKAEVPSGISSSVPSGFVGKALSSDRQKVEVSPAAGIRDDDLKVLSEPAFKYVTYITLEGSSSITDRGLKYFKSLPLLNTLNLNGTAITDAGLKALKDLPKLSCLLVGKTKLTGGGFAEFDGSEIQSLDLSETKLSNKTLGSLKKLQKLTDLNISNTAVTSEGFPALHGMKLTRLLFADIPIGKGLKGLSGMPLNSLSFYKMQINERDLAEIETLPVATSLNFDSTKSTGQVLAVATKMPKLNSVTLKGINLTSQDLIQLTQVPRLEKVVLQASTIELSDPLPEALLFERLKSLDLSATQIPAKVMERIQCPNCRSLSLGQDLDDDLLKAVKFPQLASLVIYGSKITDQGLMHLTSFPELLKLQLQQSPVTGAGVRKLKEALPRLAVYGCALTRLTDAEKKELCI